MRDAETGVLEKVFFIVFYCVSERLNRKSRRVRTVLKFTKTSVRNISSFKFYAYQITQCWRNDSLFRWPGYNYWYFNPRENELFSLVWPQTAKNCACSLTYDMSIWITKVLKFFFPWFFHPSIHPAYQICKWHNLWYLNESVWHASVTMVTGKMALTLPHILCKCL